MSDDIIRIDGVEYELCLKQAYTPGAGFCQVISIKGDELALRVRPKRKQTGLICRNLGCCEPCIIMDGGIAALYRCPGTQMADWQPFYGKVVE